MLITNSLVTAPSEKFHLTLQAPSVSSTAVATSFAASTTCS